MTATIIDGVAVAKQVRADIKTRVVRLKTLGVVPGLAVVIIGDNPASRAYVGKKITACAEVGVLSEVHEFPTDADQGKVLARIAALNINPEIHGMIVQLPLPSHLDMRRVLEAIAQDKDVDGFNQYNVGGLMIGNSVFPPCTPLGVQLLLEYSKIQIAGQNVVVVGASNIVGKPMALMLLQKEATVSLCHVKTRDLAQFTILADILVVAAGRPNLINASMVKTGAVVIDVGINRLPDGRLVGDVDFEAVKEKASYITPVPGGVGPMTVSMLIWNTVQAAERQAAKASEWGRATSVMQPALV
ncbi:MAG: bifunctional methylenetetrahydrofolate dehydrogenase/methenyltetrahydrofolate cyclohydrolase FolD [Burkholderiales bacterium]|nr:bifunctional methylenetetrahydrofolate dehydrogenase/methenyltetrahydrofolate cyclohydrolase FolD [Burkholderiales bacterium]